MSFLLRILLVAVAGLCLVGTRRVMQRHLGPARAGRGGVGYVAQPGAEPAAATPGPARSAPGADDFIGKVNGVGRYISATAAGAGSATLLLGTWSLLRPAGPQLPRISGNAEPAPAGGGPQAEEASFFVTQRF